MKDVYISSIFMPEFRFHSDVLLITFKKCQDSKESCREEDAVKKKKEKGKKSKCTLKVGLQHFWDRLQISYCHKHRHAPWSKAHTAPIVWTADAGGRKILPAVLLNTEKSICFNSLWKKHSWIKFLSDKLKSVHRPKCCFVLIDYGVHSQKPYFLTKVVFLFLVWWNTLNLLTVLFCSTFVITRKAKPGFKFALQCSKSALRTTLPEFYAK